MNLRQAERKIFFAHIFRQMPLWEVWETEIPAPTTYTKGQAQSMYEAGTLAVTDVISDTPPKPTIVRDFRLIPRRLRRQMARVRARREWRVAKGLDVPEQQYPPHITELDNSMYVNSQNLDRGQP